MNAAISKVARNANAPSRDRLRRSRLGRSAAVDVSTDDTLIQAAYRNGCPSGPTIFLRVFNASAWMEAGRGT